MKVFSSEQIRKIDAYTIQHEPIKSVDLMERAATALFEWYIKKFSKKTDFVFIAGAGNNGGDAWALARKLYHDGYKNIRFYVLGAPDKLSADSEINYKRLLEETSLQPKFIAKEKDFPFISKNEWVVDALFGTGLSRPVKGLAGLLIDYINKSDRVGVVSIDIPSGLHSEEGIQLGSDSIINATVTLSFQFPKLAFFFADSEKHVGDWKVLPIGLSHKIIKDLETPFRFIRKSEIVKLVRKPSKFSHKGTNGHALIIAGSYGMMGASVLATRSAVASGAGLVTSHTPRLGYEIIQTSVPEAIVSIDESDLIFTGVNELDKYTAIGIGPGLNTKTNTERALKELIEKAKIPMVIDADALNLLSKNKDWLESLPENTIITPHPGEFDRLTEKHATSYGRFQSQLVYSKKNKVIVILKGAYTTISFPDGSVSINSTGNAGMAKGGSGDVLTGVLTALLAQGYSSADAAKLGVYVHGLAGDISLKKKGFHGLRASDIINNLGKAFKRLE